jgi:uncharacterized protein YfiM (DUF2279 family)
VYAEAELQGLYNRVQNDYVMYNGVCWHRWQQPDGSALAYPDFVHQFKNGYAFTELSEPGSGDTVILEHHGLRRRVGKKTEGKAGGQSAHVKYAVKPLGCYWRCFFRVRVASAAETGWVVGTRVKPHFVAGAVLAAAGGSSGMRPVVGGRIRMRRGRGGGRRGAAKEYYDVRVARPVELEKTRCGI